jgi:hypothetical protein
MSIDIQLALKVAKLKGLEMYVRGLNNRSDVARSTSHRIPMIWDDEISNIADQIKKINLELVELIEDSNKPA